MTRNAIHTDLAPAAIGAYSQAVRHGDTVYLSGQLPLDPATMELVAGPIHDQVHRIFDNLAAVCSASGGSVADIAKLTVYLTDLGNFPIVNEVMAEFFDPPYPARAAIGVAALPKGAEVEVEGIMMLPVAGS